MQVRTTGERGRTTEVQTRTAKVQTRTAKVQTRTAEVQTRTAEAQTRTAEVPLRTAPSDDRSKRARHLAPRGRSQHTFFANAGYTAILSTIYLRKSSSGSLNEGLEITAGYNWTSRRGLGVGVVYSGGFISARRGGFERTSRIHYIAPEFVARQRVGRRWLFRENAGIGYGRYIRSYAGLTGSRGGVGIHESVSAEFMLTRFLGLGVTVGGQWLIVDSPDVDDGAELNLAGICRPGEIIAGYLTLCLLDANKTVRIMSKGNKMDQAALRYHSEGRPGKIAVVPTKPYHTQHDLSLAYSPGVAAPCRAIEANPDDVYRYTNKGNLIAVISNGTAVLGLGNIGALAGKPVMEGKSMLFKTFADIDAFDIEVDETDPEAFIRTVKAIAPTFGGINLEDIKAPECFEIDRRLSEELDIPVMHDDQHGTAVISTAALLNAAKIAGKALDKLRVVVNGAGAAAIACARLFIAVGVRRENMIFCDSQGVVTTYRTDINEIKREFATTRRITTLAEAIHDADVFLGVSKADVLTPEMLRTMATNPIVMALANPDPEIAYDKAVVSRPDIIFATGRSDYPNQVNNVLGFPYIFRGALDVRATKINEAMKLAAARALAELAQEPVPSMVLRAYALGKLEFGRGYLIPKPLDPRLLCTVTPAVARAAIESGVARQPITDWDAYIEKLRTMTEI